MYKLDRYCPETQIVLANYHLIRGDRLNAIKCLIRAIKLDPTNQEAWILLG